MPNRSPLAMARADVLALILHEHFTAYAAANERQRKLLAHAYRALSAAWPDEPLAQPARRADLPANVVSLPRRERPEPGDAA